MARTQQYDIQIGFTIKDEQLAGMWKGFGDAMSAANREIKRLAKNIGASADTIVDRFDGVGDAVEGVTKKTAEAGKKASKGFLSGLLEAKGAGLLDKLLPGLGTASAKAAAETAKTGVAVKGLAGSLSSLLAPIGAALLQVKLWGAQLKITSKIIKAQIIVPFKIMVATFKGAIAVTRTMINVLSTLGKVMFTIARTLLRITFAPVSALYNSFKQLGGYLIKGAIFSGIWGIINGIQSLAEEFVGFEASRFIFQNFISSASAASDSFNKSSNEMIADMQRMTNGTINITSMLTKANMALSLIGDDIASELPGLFQVAQASALATGQEIDYILESLVKGIGRLSGKWIDNSGIIVDLEGEYSILAAELGKTAASLTEVEKRQAITNAVMREGAKIVEKVGDVSIYVSTQVDRMKANFVNLRDSVVSAFSPFGTVVLGWLNNFVERAQPLVDSWLNGFIFAWKKIENVPANSIQISAQLMANSLTGAEETMGYKAGAWARKAIGWGANVAAQFVNGFLRAFLQIFQAAVSVIGQVIANWFQPHSPPKIASHIDDWGHGLMEEWVKGIVSYPVADNIGAIKDELRDVFDGELSDNLFQLGVDSIADWTKGLSMADLEFMSDEIDRALNSAKRLTDELTKSYGKQSAELFKMQVLGKDRGLINQQITKVKNTKLSMEANKSEVEQLELQKELMQEQISLLNSLKKVFDKISDGRGLKDAIGDSGGGGIDDILDDYSDLFYNLPGSEELASRVSGIGEVLKSLLEDPLQSVVDTWESLVPQFRNTWEDFVSIFVSGKNDTLLAHQQMVAAQTGLSAPTFGQAAGTYIENFTKGFGQIVTYLIEKAPAIASALSPLTDFVTAPIVSFFANPGKTQENLDKFITGFDGLATSLLGLSGTVLEVGGKIAAGLTNIMTGGMSGDNVPDYVKQYISGYEQAGGSSVNVPEAITKLADALSGNGDFIASAIADITKELLAFATMVIDNKDAIFATAKMLLSIGIAVSKIAVAITQMEMGKLGKLAESISRLGDALSTRYDGSFIDTMVGIFNLVDTFTLGPLDKLTLSINALAGALEWLETTNGKAIESLFTVLNTPINPAGTGKMIGEMLGGLWGAQDEMDGGTPKVNPSIMPQTMPSGDFNALGASVAAGIGAGLTENTDLVIGPLSQLGTDMSDAFAESIQSRSPSLVFQRHGENIVAGLVKGIVLGMPFARQTIFTFMSLTLDQLIIDIAAYDIEFFYLGQKLMWGLVTGWRESENVFIMAVVGAVLRAIAAANEAAAVASPSKKTRWTGQMIGEGLAMGVDDRSAMAVKSVGNTVNGMMNAANAGGVGRSYATGFAGSGGGTVVNFYAPVVGEMHVPNGRTGRAMSKQVADDISDNVRRRRESR